MTMLRPLALAVLLAATALATPPALQLAYADAVSDEIAALDPSVQDVRVAGPWSKDGRNGFYRIIVARTGTPQPTARLFVQWIATGVDGSEAVERSIEVTEMQALKLDVADFTSEPDSDGLSVFVELVDPTHDTDQSYELLIDDDGTYRFGPASN